MSDIDHAASLNLGESRSRGSPLVKWGLIGLVALMLLGVGGAVWYFFLGGREHFSSQQSKEVEAPLPYFLELKPFVVTMPSSNGITHFVQLGVSLQLPRAAAGEMATALLPEIQDAMRQTLLSFKSDDLQNPDGVNTVRKAVSEHLNELISSVLGKERYAKVTEGSPNGVLVQNVLFATLIVE